MNRDEIRRKTCIVIRKNGRYLRGRSLLTHELMWSWSIYEAWKTRDRAEAETVARTTGGVMVLFNPILRQTKTMGA